MIVNGSLANTSTSGQSSVYYKNIKEKISDIGDNIYTVSSLPSESSRTNYFVYGNGIWISIYGTNYEYYYISYDGITWVQKSFSSSFYHVTNLVYGNGIFVGIDTYSERTYIYYSRDGLNWSASGSRYSSNHLNILFDGYKFILIYNYSSSKWIKTSTDGVSWSEQISISVPGSYNSHTALAANGKLFFSYSSGGTVYWWYSTNGTSYTRVTLPSTISEKPSRLLWDGSAYHYVAASWEDPNIYRYTSYDGINWQADATINYGEYDIYNSGYYDNFIWFIRDRRVYVLTDWDDLVYYELPGNGQTTNATLNDQKELVYTAYDTGDKAFYYTAEEYQTISELVDDSGNNLITLPISGIESGTYYGSDTYGSSNPNQLEFSTMPSLVILQSSTHTALISPLLGIGKSGTTQFDSNLTVQYSGTTLSWYGSSSSNQMNSGLVQYTAFIASE